MSRSDSELVDEFRTKGDEDAFCELSRRYMGLIYHAALRRCTNQQLAEEAAQNTLCILVRKISDGGRSPSHLAAWLHRAATYEAGNLLKYELRHQKRKRALMETLAPASTSEGSSPWELALPHLDASLNRLADSDKQLVILHYFQKRSHGEIAHLVGKSEAAVQRQCHRCLKKLARLLNGKGAGISSATLVSLFASEAAKAVPPALLNRLPSAALASSAASTLPLTSKTLLLMTTGQKIVIAGVAVGLLAAVPISLQQARIRALNRENLELGKALQSGGGADARLPAVGDQNGHRQGNTNGTGLGDLDWPESPSEAVEMAFAILKGRELDTRLSLGGVHYASLGTNELFEYCLAVQTLAAKIRQSDVMGVNQVGVLLSQLAMLDRVGERDGKSKRAAAIGDFLKALAGIDHDAAQEVVALLDPQSRRTAYGALVSGLSVKHPSEAISFLNSLGDADLVPGLSDLNAIGRIAAHDPEETARLMDRLPVNNAAARRYELLAEEWVTNDPESALAWVHGLEFEAIRTKALASLFRAWARDDRDSAFGALDEIENTAFRRRVFGEMAMEVFQQGTEGAAEWTRTFEGVEQTYALGLLASHMASTDPQLAVRYHREALERAKDDRLPLGEPTADLGHAYALQDPIAAGEWAMEFTDWWIQEPAVAGVSQAWTAVAPVEASRWIETLPDGGARNNAIYNLVGNIRVADPAAAFQWADNITGDDGKRLYLLKLATETWTRSAPQEARAAIEALALSDSQRKLLIDRLRNGPE